MPPLPSEQLHLPAEAARRRSLGLLLLRLLHVDHAVVLAELGLVSHHHLLLLLFDGLLVELLAWGGAVVPLPPNIVYVMYNPCYLSIYVH